MSGPRLDGLLVAEKGPGVTSFQVVAHVRRLLRVPKVGHGGTLDPMATGVLPLLLGEATKLTPYLLTQNKEYLATVRLGVTTAHGTASSRVKLPSRVRTSASSRAPHPSAAPTSAARLRT